jgi:hypothetical protein
MSSDLLAAESEQSVGAPFLGAGRVDVTRKPCNSPGAADHLTFGRHGDAAPTATLPWRAISLYLDASGYAGLREHNRTTP